MFLDRIAPANGYDNDAKAEYRRQVWSLLKNALDCHPNSGRFLIMPSLEGIEIEYAVEIGIPEHRIVAVDRDPRVLDRAEWRKRYPKVECVASEIGEFHKVFRNRICCANLDLCGRFSDETVATVKSFMAKQPKIRPFFLGLTLAKGREDSTTFLLLKKVDGAFHRKIEDMRIAATLALSDLVSKDSWELLGQGSYVSSRHPMTWAVLKFYRKATDYEQLRRNREDIKRLRLVRRQQASEQRRRQAGAKPKPIRKLTEKMREIIKQEYIVGDKANHQALADRFGVGTKQIYIVGREGLPRRNQRGPLTPNEIDLIIKRFVPAKRIGGLGHRRGVVWQKGNAAELAELLNCSEQTILKAYRAAFPLNRSRA